MCAVSGDFYTWLEEVRCTTVKEAMTRFSVTYTSMRKRLIRLVKRGVLEKRMVGRVAVYCLKNGAQLLFPSRWKSLSLKTVQRAKRVVELLETEGCMSTSALRRELGIGPSPQRYVLTLLLSQGLAVEVVIGRTAIWCRDRRTAEELVARLRETAHRLAFVSRRRYIKPSELLQMVQTDRDAYVLFSRFIPLSRFADDRIHPIAKAFADSILASLYGDPVRYAPHRHVYFVLPQPRQDLGDIAIRDGTSRVVTISLPPDLAAALEDARRRCASVEELVVRAVEQLLARFR